MPAAFDFISQGIDEYILPDAELTAKRNDPPFFHRGAFAGQWQHLDGECSCYQAAAGPGDASALTSELVQLDSSVRTFAQIELEPCYSPLFLARKHKPSKSNALTFASPTCYCHRPTIR